MNDMSMVIIAKSDQLNNIDLESAPKTITVSGVSIKPGQEQPVTVRFEGDGGKPWKPCKTSCRILVAVWGKDANNYVGKSLTLFRDPKVRFGSLETGGIRISHMSHISEKWSGALQETKGRMKLHTVLPLRVEAPNVATSLPPSAEAPKRTFGDFLNELRESLEGAATEDAVQDIIKSADVQKALAGPPGVVEKVNAVIKPALDRFSEPVTDDDALWSDDSSAAA